LILQYPKEIWIIEVKYVQCSPNPTTDLVKDAENQIRGYRDQIVKLQGEGWFPNYEVQMVLFWAYWKKRVRPMGNEEDLKKWPIQR
jgi:hypothetical protein